MSQLDQVPERRRRIPALAPGRSRLLSGLLVVTLLALTAVEAPGASLRIFWRSAVLSFDHPSTQALDEVACESSTLSGAATESSQFARLNPSGRFVPVREPSQLASPGLCAGITRSPPAA